MAASDSRVDVCLDSLNNDDTPNCPHGPTLLFERFTCGSTTGKRFYACSACRDRRECSFFQWEDTTVSESKLKAREVQNKSAQPKLSHSQLFQRKETFLCLRSDQQTYCDSCGLLLMPDDISSHKGHKTKAISEKFVKSPTLLLRPLDNNKTNAQYLFSEKSVKFMVSMLQEHRFKNILCIGAPRIHEAIVSSKNMAPDEMNSLLMDIDYRLGQFYPPTEYVRYNMFNHHFFEGQDAKKVYKQFIKREQVCIVADPPFGGLVSVLAHTMKRIESEWREIKQNRAQSPLPVMWLFPYFMEHRIKEYAADFTMLDYKVDYENHPSFNSKKSSGSKHGSPVRIFTNIDPSSVELPESEGYKHCKICDRWVAKENWHCNKCGTCTSKDGRSYIHCEHCARCVKPSYQHCDACQQCLLPDHTCGQAKGKGCYICGDISHKKRECPQRKIQSVKRKSNHSSKSKPKKRKKKQ